MTRKVYLSEELCDRVREKMTSLMEAHDKGGVGIQHRAAHSLLVACQTQQRYHLNPQTPAEFERAAKVARTNAGKLASMTPEDLLKRQREALGDDYPGRPS